VVVTIIVELWPAVSDCGAKETVGPVGATLALKATVCADPLVTAVFTVVFACPPWITVAEDGESDMEKSLLAGATTVKVKVCCAEETTLVAVMVMVDEEGDVAVPASVAVPLPLSVKVTPAGSAPVSVRAGVGEPVVVTVNEPAVLVVKVVLEPEVIAGGVCTTRLKPTECCAELLVPVMVTG
jgi:hypothetical protein